MVFCIEKLMGNKITDAARAREIGKGILRENALNLYHL